MPTELRAKKARPEWSWPAKTHIDPSLIAVLRNRLIGHAHRDALLSRFWGDY
jgi:hypothetical protein